jgi:hypothetical protein
MGMLLALTRQRPSSERLVNARDPVLAGSAA